MSQEYERILKTNQNCLFSHKTITGKFNLVLFRGILLNSPTTDPPTHRLKIHRPSGKILFERLDN